MLGRAPDALRAGERAAARWERGGAALLLWGLAASVLGLVLAAILVNVHAVALLGILVFAAVLILGALGLGVAAFSVGARLGDAAGSEGGGEMLASVRLGLWSLLLSALVPFVGWLLVLLALASGVGAVLDTLVTRGPLGPGEDLEQSTDSEHGE